MAKFYSQNKYNIFKQLPIEARETIPRTDKDKKDLKVSKADSFQSH